MYIGIYYYKHTIYNIGVIYKMNKVIIFKVNKEQRKLLDRAVKKSMRTIASIARQGIMKQVKEILKK